MAIIAPTLQAPPRSGVKGQIRRHPLVAYFALTFIFSWLPVLPLTLSQDAGVGVLPYVLGDTLKNVLLVLTIFMGPTLAALIVTGMSEGRTGLTRFLKRFVQWRVGLPWYLVALFINMGIWLLAYTVVIGPQLLVAAVTHASLLVTTFLPLVAFGMVIPALDEEPGWRGFALPRLQTLYGPAWASLILG